MFDKTLWKCCFFPSYYAPVCHKRFLLVIIGGEERTEAQREGLVDSKIIYLIITFWISIVWVQITAISKFMSANSLLLGFSRFFPILKCSLNTMRLSSFTALKRSVRVTWAVLRYRDVWRGPQLAQPGGSVREKWHFVSSVASSFLVLSFHCQ